MFKFLLIFFIDIITHVISSTQIACDVMCVGHAIQYFFHFFILFSIKCFWCRSWFLFEKIKVVLHI